MIKVPTLVGTIDRRILINYQAERDVVEKNLPRMFRPKLIKGKALVGICLIRLKSIRPKGLPAGIGISSENGAHRIAVEWVEDGEIKEGVYVPRRDTSSKLSSWVGGRLFPGIHHLASFEVNEGEGGYDVKFKSEDGTFLSIEANETNRWSDTSVFDNQDCASDFLRTGSVGFSPNKSGKVFEGLQLKTKNWEVTPLSVSKVTSSFFENKALFPEGTVVFDNALLMRDIKHEWNVREAIKNEW